MPDEPPKRKLIPPPQQKSQLDTFDLVKEIQSIGHQRGEGDLWMICIICDFFLAQLFIEYCLCPRGMGKGENWVLHETLRTTFLHSRIVLVSNWARQVHKRDMDPTWVWCQWTGDLSGHALETSRISTYWFQQNLEEVVFQGGSCRYSTESTKEPSRHRRSPQIGDCIGEKQKKNRSTRPDLIVNRKRSPEASGSSWEGNCQRYWNDTKVNETEQACVC